MTTTGDVERRLRELCADVVERAQKRGASACEAYAEHVTATSASVEQNELKGASTAEHEAVGIRVFVGDSAGAKSGFAYVNRLDDDSINEAIGDAIAIANASPGDAANALVEPRPGRVTRGLWDDNLAKLSADVVVDSAARLLDQARAVDARVSVDNASFSTTSGVSAIVSSTGVSAAASEAAASYGLFGMAIDGDDVGSFDHVFDAARAHDEIDVDRVAHEYSARVLSLLEPKDGKTYKGKVLFSPDAFEEVFLEALFEAIDGDTVWKGKSRLKDKLGKSIASKGFLLVDDGTIPGAVGSASFDREGLPHRRTVIVGDGVLHAFLYDGKAARRAGARPTGHAQGSARSLPGIGTTNVRVGGGEASDEDLFKSLKDGLYVGRFSGNVDAVSGDFSGVAKGSFLVENGKKTAPVKETLIAGNVFDALQKLVAWGAKPHRNMATLCPLVLVDGIDVTAA
ncbi:MAG TPA: TldD/PmbA family protein [Myxococcota bacterium]